MHAKSMWSVITIELAVGETLKPAELDRGPSSTEACIRWMHLKSTQGNRDACIAHELSFSGVIVAKVVSL